MKPGDLVKIKKVPTWPIDDTRREYLGIILEWYDSPKSVVTVLWWHDGKVIGSNPYHTSRLEVMNGD